MLFYEMVWEQIGDVSGLKILDFGSGFGVSANHYAKDNKVIAIEPNRDMVKNLSLEYSYEQLIGSLDVLNSMDGTAGLKNAEIFEEWYSAFCDKHIWLFPLMMVV